MRKVINPGKVCEHCGSRLTSPVEAVFCDYCKEKVPEGVHINVTVFFDDYDSNAPRPEFCSWNCFFNWMRDPPFNKKKINFISLPHLGGSDKDFEKEYEAFLQSLGEN